MLPSLFGSACSNRPSMSVVTTEFSFMIGKAARKIIPVPIYDDAVGIYLLSEALEIHKVVETGIAWDARVDNIPMDTRHILRQMLLELLGPSLRVLRNKISVRA